MSDNDCQAGENGRCNCTSIFPFPYNELLCSYDSCRSDSDCNGTVCRCREDPTPLQTTQNYCFPAGNCLQDSDCGVGGYCSPSLVAGCGAGTWYGYFCHTPGDECMDDSDCAEGNAYCAFDGTSAHWICSTGLCIDN